MKKNAHPEIEAAVEEGCRLDLAEAANYIKGIKQIRITYIFRRSAPDRGGVILSPDCSHVLNEKHFCGPFLSKLIFTKNKK